MSRIGGNSTQPASSTIFRTSTAAPHAGQFWASGSMALEWPHQGQAYSRNPAIARLASVGLVVVVHRLDAEPPRPGHPDEAHAQAAEKARGQLLHLDLHCH